MAETRIATSTQIAKLYGLHRSTVCKLSKKPGAPKPVPWMKRRHWFVEDWDQFLRSSA